MEASNPPVTISLDQVAVADCPHCGATTVQVKGGSGFERDGERFACLQCIADTTPGSGCCSLKPLDRRA